MNTPTVKATKAVPRVWLDPIPSDLREWACEQLESGDVLGFLCKAQNEYGLHLVAYNCRLLMDRGLYEKALLHAYTATRTNNRHWSELDLQDLFLLAQRDRMLAAGDPLPAPGPYTLYRGVAGRGRARRIQGYSWTASKKEAQWFATRFDLPDPAVFRTVVDSDDVFAYCNDRQEQEFVLFRKPEFVHFPKRTPFKVTRVWPAKGENVAQTKMQLDKAREEAAALRAKMLRVGWQMMTCGQR